MMSTHAPAVDDFVDRVLDVINCEPVETDNFLRSVFSQFGDVEFIVRWSSAGLKHHAFVGFRDPQPVAVVVHKQLPQALSRGWRLSRLNPDLRERVASMVPPGTDTSPGIHPPPPNDSLVSPRLSNQDRIRSHSRSQLPVNGWQPGPHSEGRAAPRSNWDRDPVRRSFPSPGDVPPYGRTMPPPSEYDLYDVGPVMSGPPLDLDPIRGVHHGDHRVRGRFERNRSLSPPPGWGGPATPDWDLARPLSPRLRGRNRSPQRLSSHSIPGPPPRPPFPHDPRDHGLHVAEKGPAPGPFYNPEHDRWPRRPPSPQWIVPGPGAFGIPKRARSMSRERPSHPNRQPRTSDVRMSTEKDRHRKHQREASQTHLKSSNDTAADTSVPRGRSVSPVGQRGVWPPADALGQSVDPRQPLNNKSSVTTVSSPTPLSASAESFSTAPVRDSTSSVSTIPAAVEATPIQLGPAETAVDLMMSPGFELPSHPASLTERMKQEKAPMEAYMGLAQEYAKHDVNLAEWVCLSPSRFTIA
ncbi:uncharacterized protein EI90DRAFT_675211 [Cantharellus anzutake]|uniref:uncharacterized protein n=1 Tax=Cantharellus anzutake TaxID=1750568 RepID=UPI001902DC91|nr:uncharacterized protein EI90DRAFT_675211 [Cantharellus anzutake]KAF8332606.1 hypothetical protein EI90DRAFT_675211 [Cantharellus anzutake]